MGLLPLSAQRTRGVIPTLGMTENLYAIRFLKMDGRCVSSKPPFLSKSRTIGRPSVLWDGIRVNVQPEEKGGGGARCEQFKWVETLPHRHFVEMESEKSARRRGRQFL